MLIHRGSYLRRVVAATLAKAHARPEPADTLLNAAHESQRLEHASHRVVVRL